MRSSICRADRQMLYAIIENKQYKKRRVIALRFLYGYSMLKNNHQPHKRHQNGGDGNKRAVRHKRLKTVFYVLLVD